MGTCVWIVPGLTLTYLFGEGFMVAVLVGPKDLLQDEWLRGCKVMSSGSISASESAGTWVKALQRLPARSVAG